MAIPISCPSCGDIIGVESERNTVSRAMAGISYSDIFYTSHLSCPGKGKHPEPRRTEYFVYKNWVKYVTIYYPETNTDSTFYQYYGPKTKFALWRSKFFGPLRGEDFFVDGKLVRWDSDGKHHGEVLALFK